VNVEFYDKEGNEVVSFFGVRSREKPVPQAWIDLTATLPKLGTANQASR
jgi:putative hemin transport protein